MEPQAANARPNCPVCGQVLQLCVCGSSTGILSHEQTFLVAPSDTASVQPRLTAGQESSDIGTIVHERYELVGELGSGGMGTVYKARHIGLPKFFAVKILRRDLSSDSGFRARFEQEAKTASLLEHPHLVSIYDYGTTSYGEAYLVMDFIAGQSLADALTRLKRIEQRKAVKIFMQICQGLHHAHGLGIIHRDLKPSNVMLINNDVAADFVKVVDFGIAKMINADGGITQSMTKTGEFFGSPLYISPEQATGGKLDRRTDIYSLGILIYECLTGSPPFRGETWFDTINMHIEAQPRDFPENLGISDRLEGIVFKALEKNPDNRQQSMEEMRLDLQAVFADDQSAAARSEVAGNTATQKTRLAPGITPDSANPKNISPVLIVATMVVFILIGVCGYFYFVRRTAVPIATSSAINGGSPRTNSAAEPELPEIPESVKLPESASNMSAGQLTDEGNALATKGGFDLKDLMPARYLTAACQLDPYSARAYGSLTDYYWVQFVHAPQTAKSAFLEKCRKVDSAEIKHIPKEFYGYWHRLTVYIEQERLKEALADIDTAFTLKPESDGLHLKRAYVFYLTKNFKGAIKEYEEHMHNCGITDFFVLGSCYGEIKEYDKAIKLASKCLKIFPKEEHDRFYLLRGDAEKELGLYKEALADYQEMKKLTPDPHIRDYQIAQCQAKLNDR